MEDRAQWRRTAWALIVWSIVPILAIYRMVGWYGVLAVSVLVHSRKLNAAAAQYDIRYAHVLSVQRKVCGAAMFVLLWQTTGYMLNPPKPNIFYRQNIWECINASMKTGDICLTADKLFGNETSTFMKSSLGWLFWDEDGKEWEGIKIGRF